MLMEKKALILEERHDLHSKHLNRDVTVDFFLPAEVTDRSDMSLLLINDGQDMATMHFKDILEKMYEKGEIRPVMFAAIHAGKDRKNEYGTAGYPDYKNRGARAGRYTYFVFEELLPYIRKHFKIAEFRDKSFAGFSLGGLMALDIVWNHPAHFSHVGVFSGSLWWRSKGLDDGYVEEHDRIMHARIREGKHAPWLKFFFQTGVLDETADRNNNGIIDSIDDTLSLIEELEKKGYSREKDIVYLELADGRHDVPTWGKAMPAFLRFAYGKS
ncbi:MAG TPA: alpha/beta hydrolase-fold protein [Chitinophagaceae bacterium]|nr:alpha/beta hydrolase-fold protein [Chitinophagaceae bacterium]